MTTENTSPAAQKARALFTEGYNCAQSVYLAFADQYPFDEKTAARLASSFGGGMGRLREVCGAVSGMFLALGTICGYDDPASDDAKKAQYATIQALAKEFRERHGAIVCRELLALKTQASEPTPEPRTPQYYHDRRCADFCADAAEILEKYLATRAEN